VVLRVLMTPWFSYRAVRRAEELAAKTPADKKTIIHQTEPNSPVATRWTSSRFTNVFGPINGNIYYPKSFRKFESVGTKIRRLLHFPLQTFNRLFWRGIANAELVLVAGGERTVRSLLAAGVRAARMHQTLDCGIPDSLSGADYGITQKSIGRFIHFGRLVFHKGTFLAIEAVAKAADGVTLDVVGRGPELQRCKDLVEELKVTNRVRFLDWYERREDLVASFKNYCGVILPSIEDANGIVVQESMAVGLVPICLDWGGPQLLIEHGKSGFLITPQVLEDIAPKMALCLDLLASDPNRVAELSAHARARASQWRWSTLAREWVGQYEALSA
jgi:glycosyltransferase involved in cell wall biosynthesis